MKCEICGKKFHDDLYTTCEWCEQKLEEQMEELAFFDLFDENDSGIEELF